MKRPALPISIILILSTIVSAQQTEDPTKPLKVYLLVGQSNMQGHARIHTLEHVGMDSKTESIFATLADEDGVPKTFDQVWINSLSPSGIKKGNLTAGFGADDDKIGPELAFGAFIQPLVGEPILIIKIAWGGKSLHTDFRSPSPGEFQFSESQIARFKKQQKDLNEIKEKKKQATGEHYRLMINHVKSVLGDIKATYPSYDLDAGYELSGFVWFQGWNDMVDGGVYPERGKEGGFDEYSKWLAHFIRDVRSDLAAPNLPFVIGVMGVGGPTERYNSQQRRNKAVHQSFRKAMLAPAKLPEFKDNVAAVLTEKYWDQELAALRARQAKIDGQIRKAKKEEGLKQSAVRELREKMMSEEFSDEELSVMKKGISNLEYHYLGSAKIMTQIGKAFAEKMNELAK